MGLTGALRRLGVNSEPGGINVVGSLAADNIIASQGETYYFDPTNGSDSYTGRTPGTAFATIAYGYTKQIGRAHV